MAVGKGKGAEYEKMIPIICLLFFNGFQKALKRTLPYVHIISAIFTTIIVIFTIISAIFTTIFYMFTDRKSVV